MQIFSRWPESQAMQAKLLRLQGESQQTQGWTQLGMGLLANLSTPATGGNRST